MLGYGVGLRRQHYSHVLETRPKVDWFEVISENFMVAGGRALEVLEGVRASYPIAMHGVSLSIGSTDPLNRDYLRQLRDLARRFEPAWISDHLCWTGVGGRNLHDLLPLPYTDEALRHVVARIREVQDILERPILIENVSSYMAFADSTMTEWEFHFDDRRRSRLRYPARHQQHLRERVQPSLRRQRLYRRGAGRARRAVPSRGA